MRVDNLSRDFKEPLEVDGCQPSLGQGSGEGTGIARFIQEQQVWRPPGARWNAHDSNILPRVWHATFGTSGAAQPHTDMGVKIT